MTRVYRQASFGLLGLCLLLSSGLASCHLRRFNSPKAIKDTRTASGSTSLPSAETNLDEVKAWARKRVADAEVLFRSAGFSREPSPDWWGNEVVYQIQVDRFSDGNTKNNTFNIESTQKSNELLSEKGIADYRHGGDLQGIIQRLDYLKQLGITTLWITPVLQSNGSYHGYCTTDFTRVDEGFSEVDPEEGRLLLRKLTKAAHSRGMKVVLDVVVNHVCDSSTRYNDKSTPFVRDTYRTCVQTLAARNWDATTQPVGQRTLLFGDTFFPPLRNSAFFSRCGHGGDHEGDAAVWGDFSDAMLDFDTNNRDFQEIFTELHKYWLAYADIDGFRVDAAKHVTSDFIAYFSTHIRAYAESLGKKNFFLVGEVAGSAAEQAERVGRMTIDPANPEAAKGRMPEMLLQRLKDVKNVALAHKQAPFPGLNALYDFGHSAAAVAVNRGDASPLVLKNWFWQGGETESVLPGAEFGRLIGQQDTRLNWNVLEIHDWPRFLLYAKGAHASDPNSYEAYNGLGHLLTAPGVPVLYYGIEQGLNGDCHADKITVGPAARAEIDAVCARDDFSNHVRYRQNMFSSGVWRLGSVVPSINALAGIGRASVNPGAGMGVDDPYLDTRHALFQHAAKLIAIRRSCKPLREGGGYFRAVHRAEGNAGGGFYAFSRISGGDEALVLVNASKDAKALDKLTIDKSLHADEVGERYVDLVAWSARATVTDGGGTLDFDAGYKIPPQSVAVFYSEKQAQPRLEGGGTCR